MLKAEQILTDAEHVDDTLTLTFELRQKSRLVAKLESGRDVLLQLPRGHVLRDGTLLAASDGSVIGVRSAPETLSAVSSDDPRSLLEAAYHLGNRHVALEIRDRELRYLHDHVLDDMLRGLGLSPRTLRAAFEPEPGAYTHGAPHHHHGAGEHEH